MKAIILMIVRHLHRVNELLTVLDQPTYEMQTLRALLTEDGDYPSRRTWERRLKSIPETLPAQIGCVWAATLSESSAPGVGVAVNDGIICGRGCAIDSTALRGKGGVWHKKDRDKGEVPHTSIDTEAHWTKSGWHGWIYGWNSILSPL